MADEALAAGCNVTVLFGAANAQQVYPSSLLPDEVEYVVATDDGSFGHHGRVTAMVARCSHRGAPLDEGAVVDGCLECPWHRSRFSLDDGSVVRGPAVAPQAIVATVQI